MKYIIMKAYGYTRRKFFVILGWHAFGLCVI